MPHGPFSVPGAGWRAHRAPDRVATPELPAKPTSILDTLPRDFETQEQAAEAFKLLLREMVRRPADATRRSAVPDTVAVLCSRRAALGPPPFSMLLGRHIHLDVGANHARHHQPPAVHGAQDGGRAQGGVCQVPRGPCPHRKGLMSGHRYRARAVLLFAYV